MTRREEIDAILRAHPDVVERACAAAEEAANALDAPLDERFAAADAAALAVLRKALPECFRSRS